MYSLSWWMVAVALLVYLGMACGRDGEKVLPTGLIPLPTPSEIILPPTPTPIPTSGGLAQHSTLDAEGQSGADTGGHPEEEPEVDEESSPPKQWIVRASREEDAWRARWQEGLISLRESFEEIYPDDFHDANTEGGKYVVVMFRDGLLDDADALLDDFSDEYNVQVKVEYLSGYSEADLKEAIKRVNYSVYCDQYTVNAETYADDTGQGAVIRSEVLISADSEHDIDSYRLGAQEALESGPHEGLSVVVEESESLGEGDEAERERVCDEYSRYLPFGEWDMRSYARQQGISYEELAYYSGWHEEFRSVVGRIERDHPRAYVDHAYGSVGPDGRFSRDNGNRRSVMVGFHGDVPPGARDILEEFGRDYGIEIGITDNMGFSEREMSDVVPKVYYAIVDADGVAGASGGGGWDRVEIRVSLEPGVLGSRIEELQSMGQDIIEAELGEDTGLRVVVDLGETYRLILD